MKLRNAGPLLIATMAFLSFSGCDQAPVFTTISNETKPADALIEGNPSDIVSFGSTANGERLWVANGYLWTYDGTAWTRIPRPGTDPVRQLAATSTAIFALTVGGGDTTYTNLYMTTDNDPTDGTIWTEIANGSGTYTRIANIHAAGTELYAGACTVMSTGLDGTFAVLHYNGTSLTETDVTGLGTGGELAGAAYAGSTYYLAIGNMGIYASTSTASGFSAISGSVNSAYSLTGITAVGNQFVAVGKQKRSYGYIIYGTGTTVTATATQDSYLFSGAMCLYNTAPSSDSTADYLLLGIDEDDSYDYGYVAILLSGGTMNTTDISGIGEGLTVSDSDQYDTSLRVEPVMYLHQFTGSSGDKNYLFASTVCGGLWVSKNAGDWAAVEY